VDIFHHLSPIDDSYVKVQGGDRDKGQASPSPNPSHVK